MSLTARERDILLAAKGVGPKVVERLEQLGYQTLSQLAQANAGDITRQLAAMLGTTCWRNSPQARAAITNAIEAARQDGVAQS